MLPLHRRGLVFSALVIGSMAPDFEYFFGLARPVSHSFPGVISFTLPLAIVVLIIFHALVKWPLISLLPCGLQARMIGPAQRFQWWPPARLALILASLSIGIATHLFWDSFTHVDGWCVIHWRVLQSSAFALLHRQFRVFQLLQVGGTALGMFALALNFARWYKRAAKHEVGLRPQFSPATKWTILSAMSATAVVLGVVNGAKWHGALLHGASGRMHFLIGWVISTTTVGAVELFGFGLIWRIFLDRRLQQDRVSASVKR